MSGRVRQRLRAQRGSCDVMSALIIFWGLSERGQFTLMPATTRPSRCQKARNSLASSEPRTVGGPETSVGNPGVFHADVELVGVEVGDRVQDGLLAEHGLRRHFAAVQGIGPVLAAVVLPGERVKGVGDVAGGEDPGRGGPQRSVREDSVAQPEPGRRGEGDLRDHAHGDDHQVRGQDLAGVGDDAADPAGRRR